MLFANFTHNIYLDFLTVHLVQLPVIRNEWYHVAMLSTMNYTDSAKKEMQCNITDLQFSSAHTLWTSLDINTCYIQYPSLIDRSNFFKILAQLWILKIGVHYKIAFNYLSVFTIRMFISHQWLEPAPIEVNCKYFYFSGCRIELPVIICSTFIVLLIFKMLLTLIDP